MLVANTLNRVFLFKENQQEIRLADPGKHFSPDAVLNFYTSSYPMLVTAKVEGPVISNDEVQYKFNSTLGTKG